MESSRKRQFPAYYKGKWERSFSDVCIFFEQVCPREESNAAAPPGKSYLQVPGAKQPENRREEQRVIELLQGIGLGVAFGVPSGICAARTVERAQGYGERAGLASGWGSALAALLYGGIGWLLLGIAQPWLRENTAVCGLLGGVLLLALGIGRLAFP